MIGRGAGHPTVSCVLLTDGLSAESASWFAEICQGFDEFVIMIDTSKANARTRTAAHALGTVVHEVCGRGCVEEHLPEMVRACKGDWILRLDSDERLSAAWRDGRWRRYLTAEYTHFTVPRRWLHPEGGYLNSAPWWPDPQMRLFRNDLSRIIFPQQIHDPTLVSGASTYLPHLAIEHHVLRLHSRAEREEKVRHYTRLRPELPLGHYYLFEEQSPTRAGMKDVICEQGRKPGRTEAVLVATAPSP